MAGDLLDDYVMNLGKGGILIHSELPLTIGQPLSFDLSFPGLLEPLEMEGVVRWRREHPAEDRDPADQTAIFGVEFSFPNDEKRLEWEALIFELEEASAAQMTGSRLLRVLLVEDNDFIRQMLDYAIRRFHFDRCKDTLIDVVAAASAKEALELMESASIDIAIVDHFLPGMTGCDLVRQIRQDASISDLPILVVSTGGDEVKRAAQQAGADMFLQKPVLRRVLIETIGTLTHIRQLRDRIVHPDSAPSEQDASA